MTSYTDINFHLLWYFSNSNAITFCNFTNRNLRLHISPHRLYLKSQSALTLQRLVVKFFTAIQIHKSWALYNCQWVLNTEIKEKIMFCYRNEVKRQKEPFVITLLDFQEVWDWTPDLGEKRFGHKTKWSLFQAVPQMTFQITFRTKVILQGKSPCSVTPIFLLHIHTPGIN